MAPSVDKQSTKMVNIMPSNDCSEEKPMEICTSSDDDEVATATCVVNDATVFPHDYASTTCYVHELCKKNQQQQQQQQSFLGFHTTTTTTTTTTMMNSDEHDSYEQLNAATVCRCSFVTPQLAQRSTAESKQRRQQEEDTWYRELMRGVVQGGIAINGGVDAIRQTPLQLSVRRGDYEMMERLLRAGANVDAHDSTGTSALHLAAQLADFNAAQILLRHGASTRTKTPRGFDPLTLAVQSSSIQLVKLLLDRADCYVNQLVDDYDMKRQFTLLHWAIEWNHLQMVDFLLQMQADVNQRDSYGNTCLHLASRLGRFDIVRLLVRYGARVHDKNFNNLTALYFAVENGHRDIFELLLLHGANLNDRGLGGATLLHYAIKNGDVELIDTLLHRGAHVDATNRFGKTPLHFAVAQKNWRALELLLEHGADVNSKDALGKTPLHTAIECCRKEIYDMLLRRGADVNAKDNLQQTPLHYAVRQGCYATVELLLRHSADANARDGAQQTPLHLAVRFGHVRLLEPMLRHNVDINALDASGQSPLHLAVLNEHAKLIYCGYPYTFFAQLLKNGARVRTKTVTTGETPLHAAVRKRCSIFAKHLLSHGSEVDAIESVERKTSLLVAVENDDAECVEQLLTYGADVANVIFNQKISQDVLQRFARHFIRKLAADMNVDPKYSKIISDDEFARQCEDEVKKLKLTKLYNEQTYYEFLRGNRRCLVNFVANNEVCTVFEDHARTNFPSDESMLRSNFPVFADMLDKNYRVGVRYAPVFNASFERLISLFQLPVVPTERILDFLDDSDMRHIIKVMPSLAN